MKYNLIETRFFLVNRDNMGGLEIERKLDNASLYFQPGDDAKSIEEDIERLLGRNKKLTEYDYDVVEHYLSQFSDLMTKGEMK
jgi:hypothetical protein